MEPKARAKSRGGVVPQKEKIGSVAQRRAVETAKTRLWNPLVCPAMPLCADQITHT